MLRNDREFDFDFVGTRCCVGGRYSAGFGLCFASGLKHDFNDFTNFASIQANPPSLLSNIQYIEDFYACRVENKEAYWWTQFISAVEFLKQLLNKLLI